MKKLLTVVKFRSNREYTVVGNGEKGDVMKLLSQFNIGERGVITKVNGEGRIRRRLFDMGVTPKAYVIMKKRAPMGDPIEINIRGYELTLRKAEAACVEVEVE